MSREPIRPSPRGAQNQRARSGNQLRSWARHHRTVSLDSARRLLRHPLGSLMTMLAIAIALVLPTALWLTLDSARLLDAELDESATLTAYLTSPVDDGEARRIDEALAARTAWPVPG